MSPFSDILSPELVKKLVPFHLSNEGEFEGVARECGLPNFFPILGNLPMCRFYSSHISLSEFFIPYVARRNVNFVAVIKAKEEGLFNGTYKHSEDL